MLQEQIHPPDTKSPMFICSTLLPQRGQCPLSQAWNHRNSTLHQHLIYRCIEEHLRRKQAQWIRRRRLVGCSRKLKFHHTVRYSNLHSSLNSLLILSRNYVTTPVPHSSTTTLGATSSIHLAHPTNSNVLRKKERKIEAYLRWWPYNFGQHILVPGTNPDSTRTHPIPPSGV